MLERRKFFAGFTLISTIGLISACSHKGQESNNVVEPETTPSSADNPSQEPLNSAEDDVLLNGALIFGPEDFFLTKIVVLDLGSHKSRDFFYTHKETLMNSYDDYRGIGICLTDFSDTAETSHGAVYALNASMVAVAVFEENRELFWEFLSRVYDQLEEIAGSNQEPEDHQDHSHVPDLELSDFVEIALELGLPDNIQNRVDNPVVEALVRNMTMTVDGIVNESPALLENRELWNGDLNNTEEVDEWLNREF